MLHLFAGASASAWEEQYVGSVMGPGYYVTARGLGGPSVIPVGNGRGWRASRSQTVLRHIEVAVSATQSAWPVSRARSLTYDGVDAVAVSAVLIPYNDPPGE